MRERKAGPLPSPLRHPAEGEKEVKRKTSSSITYSRWDHSNENAHSILA